MGDTFFVVLKWLYDVNLFMYTDAS